MKFSNSGFPSVKNILPVLALLLPLSAGNAFAQDQASLFDDLRVAASFGTEYSNGSYETERNTNVELGLTTLSLATDNFKFNISMPYMRISGRGLVVFDASGNPIVINRRTALPPDVRTGFGDLNLSATYTVPAAILDDFEVRLTGSTKISTASERKRLSTGQADYGLSLDVSRQFGSWGPFVTVGYLMPGQPATYKLYDTTSVSVGTSLELSDDLVAVASYDYDSASTPLVTASHELFGSLSWVRGDRVTLTGYGTYGLSNGSPDVGLGMLVSYGFN
jgi:hypothetical protein